MCIRDRHEAAHAAAIFFSLMGCCRENKVNPKLWMQDVLIRVQAVSYTHLVADLRGKSPVERAKAIIENGAHPDYKNILWDYVKMSSKGQTPHGIPAALAMHDTLAKKGDMRLIDWAEYKLSLIHILLSPNNKPVAMVVPERDNPGITAQACARPIINASFMPVSYTHLDVYKRQTGMHSVHFIMFPDLPVI